MDADVKGAWVDALRSGRYPKGVGRLCGIAVGDVAEQYCCLGVLSELAVEAGVAKRVRNNIGKLIGYVSLTDEQEQQVDDNYLAPAIMAWAGLESRNPTINNAPLSNWNDLLGASFNRIADLIEENL